MANFFGDRMGKLQGWMKVVCVLNESLEVGQRKRGCTNDVVDVPFNETR